MRHEFEKTHDGKTYKCFRDVEGKRKFRQTITVVGVGSKRDPATYGPKNHPIESMQATAGIIAYEILQGFR